MQMLEHIGDDLIVGEARDVPRAPHVIGARRKPPFHGSPPL